MRPRIVVIAAVIFVAYLLGAKAGTSRYREIVGAFSSIWNDPKVKNARKRAAKDVAKSRKAATKQAKRHFA